MEENGWREGRTWIAPKIRIPGAVRGTVVRERLMESLAGGDEQIVLLHAGAGYGKTTVMAEWARNHRERSCWYHLHESDNDLRRFLCGIAASFCDTLQEDVFGEDGPVRREGGDLDTVSERFLACCFTALPEGGFYVCLDDFHVIRSETVQAFLLRFMEYGEGRIRFFVTAKGDFPEFLSVCMLQGRVREIGAEDLRFAQGETGLLLEQIAQKPLPESVARSVQEYTRGWAAGIVFVGMGMKNGTADDRTHLYYYISHEIFRKLTYDMQQFMTDTSVFEMIDIPVCNYALNRTDAEGMLEYIVREELFLSRVMDERCRYRYDGVFAGFLRSKLKAARREEILLRAANYYARHGAWENAVQCGMQCGEKGCSVIAAVAERRAQAMADAGEQALLDEWIAYLCGFSDSLSESALFFLYRCLRGKREVQRGMEFLYQAAQKAYGKQQYAAYAEYMCELAECTGEQNGPAAAAKIAAEACGQLEGRGSLLYGTALYAGGTERCLKRLRSMQAAVEESVKGTGEENGEKNGRRKQKSGKGVQGAASLFVRCLGALTVRGQGGELLWRTKKTKELFACLFYEEGKWVPRDVLMERLWPEKPLEKAVVLFHTTVSYLRRNMTEEGAENVLLTRNRSYALDMARIDSDMDVFREWYGALKEEGKSPKERDPALLLALYGGSYMQGEDYLWLGAYQEQIESRYLWMIKELAGREMKKKNFISAVQYLEKAAEIDPYELKVRELLLGCRISEGNPAGAKKEYERLRSVYQELTVPDELPAFESYVKRYRVLP